MKNKILKKHIKNKLCRVYQRKAIYTIEEVLSKVDFSDPKEKVRVDFNNNLIKMSSHRLQLFKTKGVTCAHCGIEGKYFAMEKPPVDKSYHFNLYAVNEKGEEVLMTKDHIIPRKRGGLDCLDNFQTLCIKCNVNKGSKLESELVKEPLNEGV